MTEGPKFGIVTREGERRPAVDSASAKAEVKADIPRPDERDPEIAALCEAVGKEAGMEILISADPELEKLVLAAKGSNLPVATRIKLNQGILTSLKRSGQLEEAKKMAIGFCARAGLATGLTLGGLASILGNQWNVETLNQNLEVIAEANDARSEGRAAPDLSGQRFGTDTSKQTIETHRDVIDPCLLILYGFGLLGSAGCAAETVARASLKKEELAA